MQEIKCPKCGEVFQVDESGYAAILKQVRDSEFQKEIKQREKNFASEMNLAIDLAVTEKENEKTESCGDRSDRAADCISGRIFYVQNPAG